MSVTYGIPLGKERQLSSDKEVVTKNSFAKVLKATWIDHEHFRMSNTGHGGFDEIGDRCVQLPSYPSPDRVGASRNPFQWYLDFADENRLDPKREEQLKKLNVLVKTGLLKSEPVTVDIDSEVKNGVRFTLTDFGWKSTSLNVRGGKCFVYGTVQFLGVENIKPRGVSEKSGVEIYDVTGAVGFRSESDLREWARDKELQALFKEVQEDLQGKPFTRTFIRGRGEWEDYNQLLKNQRIKNKYKTDLNQPSYSEYLENRKKLDKPKAVSSFPPPTEDELKRLVSINEHPALNCLNLPGRDSRLPVDKWQGDETKYRVSIFSDKKRNRFDKVALYSIPYLEQLVNAKVLIKTPVDEILGEGKDKGKNFKGYEYTMLDKYEKGRHKRYQDCMMLGDSTVQFVDLRIRNNDYSEYSNFFYRARYVYTRPEWVDDRLMKYWPELRLAISEGKVGQGSFAFHRKTREKSSGAASSWWGFNSYLNVH